MVMEHFLSEADRKLSCEWPEFVSAESGWRPDSAGSHLRTADK